MSVKLLADHTTIIIAAGDAQRVGKFYGATVRAGGFGGEGGFPVGTTMSLIGVTNTLLGNWHGENSSISIGSALTDPGHRYVATILTKKSP